MSGIMTAIAGGGAGIVYTAGLYGPTGTDLSPISSSATNTSTFSRTWIGYYLAASTKSYSFGITATWTSGYNAGTQYSRGYVWVGALAKSGYTTGNATASADNSTGTGSVSLTAGLYYPIRIQWDANVPQVFDGVFFYSTSGALTFRVDSSTNVSGAIYYNQLTNGF